METIHLRAATMVDAALFSSWLSPTSLFILLNIVIATIFLFSSAFTNKNHHRDTGGAPSPTPPHFGRVPSLFSRVVSFNHYSYQQYRPELHDSPVAQPDPEPQSPLTRPPSLLSRVSSFNFSGLYGPTKPDPEPPVTEGKSGNSKGVERSPSLLYRGLYRSVQPGSVAPVIQIQQQPQQAEGKKGNEEAPKSRAGKRKKKVVPAVKTASCRSEEEVDARADNFINKFRQQLHMQRLQSLMRYRNSTT